MTFSTFSVWQNHHLQLVSSPPKETPYPFVVIPPSPPPSTNPWLRQSFCVCVGLLILFSKNIFKLFIYLFIFREKGREGEREGEKHHCVVASHTPATGDLAHNPGVCPDRESNQQPLGLQEDAQPLSHQSGWVYLFQIFHINGIIQYVAFFVWLLSLGVIFLSFIHIVVYYYFIPFDG